jgi:hypothetical protein
VTDETWDEVMRRPVCLPVGVFLGAFLGAFGIGVLFCADWWLHAAMAGVALLAGGFCVWYYWPRPEVRG